MMMTWNEISGLKAMWGSMYVQRGTMAAPVAPMSAADSANTATFTPVGRTPSTSARSSSPPIASSARPHRERRTSIAAATESTAMASSPQ